MAKGKLRHIHIDTAANGYMISHHKEEAGGKGRDMAMPTESAKQQPHLARTRQEVRDHVDQLLAEHEGGAVQDGAEPDQDDMMMPEHPLRKLSRRR